MGYGFGYSDEERLEREIIEKKAQLENVQQTKLLPRYIELVDKLYEIIAGDPGVGVSDADKFTKVKSYVTPVRIPDFDTSSLARHTANVDMSAADRLLALVGEDKSKSDETDEDDDTIDESIVGDDAS